ncbi:hypothetical protein V499_04561 [Pseudogymnoascus sp. VKM F-103]|nr:hypothetical protein V499_04561 [Pseudogymnoascus sp. VKM F-103]
MRSKLIAAVLIAPALIGALPVANPDAKIVLNLDTFSPPQLVGTPMPAKHTSPHHFADGVTDEGLKRMMGARDNKIATPKEEIIVHPYRPFADPTNGKEREHVELFDGDRKVHSRGFRQEVRNADNTERPNPNDHYLGPKIGTPINARAIDNTGSLPHPNGHLLPPKIGTPIDARYIDNTENRLHPDDHHPGLAPKIGTPIDARAIDYTEILPRPNGHLLTPKIGTPIDVRAIGNTERPYSHDHHLAPKIGTPINARAIDYAENRPRPDGHLLPPKIGTPIGARAIDNADRLPHPDDHHLGPKIGTPIDAKSEEPKESEGLEIPVDLPLPSNYDYEEFDDQEEIPVELPISSDHYPDKSDEVEEIPVELPIPSDYYPGKSDDVEEMPVELPIPSDYDYEEFDDQEEMPVDLPILSDYNPESSDYEDSRYIPATPGDRNSRRPGRLAGPPFPCAGPLQFNGTGFNTTINGTTFNNTTNGTAVNITRCFEEDTSDFNEDTSNFKEDTSDFEEATSDLEEPSEPTLRRRESKDAAMPELVQAFETRRKENAEKKAAKDKASKEKADKERAKEAAKVEAAKARQAEEKASREEFEKQKAEGRYTKDFEAWKKQIWERKSKEADAKAKNPHVPVFANPKAKSKAVSNIEEYAPEFFDYLKDPFKTPSPFEQDKAWSEDLIKKIGKPRHPLYWAQRGVENIEPPKREPGHEWPEARHPVDVIDKDKPETGFSQGDGWKTDYFQNGVWGQPRVPKERKPYWTADGNPVY